MGSRSDRSVFRSERSRRVRHPGLVDVHDLGVVRIEPEPVVAVEQSVQAGRDGMSNNLGGGRVRAQRAGRTAASFG